MPDVMICLRDYEHHLVTDYNDDLRYHFFAS